MRFKKISLCVALTWQFFLPSGAEGQLAAKGMVDSTAVVNHLRYLSDPALEGRAVGSAGNARARNYIVETMENIGLEPVGDRWDHPFDVGAGPGGVNIIGRVEGTVYPERYVYVTAHYDHLGRRDGVVYPGADDNASGTAAILEIARLFVLDPPRHTLLFVAFDAEEGGLRGARALVADPPVPNTQAVLDVNLDMVGRNVDGELFAAGTYSYPFLEPLVDSIARVAPLTLRKGHDRPHMSAGTDWTGQSDQGAFHAVGIPFLYFGVEDHPDYHRPTDTFENIEPRFYVNAVRTIYDWVRLADESLDP